MTPEEVERQVDTFELINAELAGSHDRQSDALDKIDGKVVVIIGYVVAAGAFLATRQAEPVLEVLAYLAFAVALAFGISAYAIRNYEDIDPVALFRYYPPMTKAQTLARLGAMRAKHYQFNQKLHVRKAARWNLCLAGLLAGTVLMIAAILVQTYVHDHRRGPAGPARPAASASAGARCIPAEPCGIQARRSH